MREFLCPNGACIRKAGWVINQMILLYYMIMLRESNNGKQWKMVMAVATLNRYQEWHFWSTGSWAKRDQTWGMRKALWWYKVQQEEWRVKNLREKHGVHQGGVTGVSGYGRTAGQGLSVIHSMEWESHWMTYHPLKPKTRVLVTACGEKSLKKFVQGNVFKFKVKFLIC